MRFPSSVAARLVWRAAIIVVLCAWLVPAHAQRPMMGYEPPHKRAERLRAEAAARNIRGPAMSREAPRGQHAPQALAAESFWGEPIEPVAFQGHDWIEHHGAPIMDDGLMMPQLASEGPWHVEGVGESCSQCAGGSHCGSCLSCDGCLGCPAVLQWVEAFAGAHGFTGPMNLGQSGSFGFNEGVNLGLPFNLCAVPNMSIQLGGRVVHSNFSSALLTPEERTQVFLTGGAFRRVDEGFQFGLVLDYMHDQWYHDPDIVQLRGEFAYLWNPAGEVGFWFTAPTQRSSATTRLEPPGQGVIVGTQTFEATDLYSFYLRRRFGPALTSTARLSTGFTGNQDGFLGAELEMPLTPCWGVQSGFSYLIPTESQATGFREESWNVFFGVVWRPRGFACGDYHRPLFRVADNGSFMVDLVDQ